VLDESGEGKNVIDMKCAHCKIRLAQNARYGKCNAVDADSRAETGASNRNGRLQRGHSRSLLLLAPCGSNSSQLQLRARARARSAFLLSVTIITTIISQLPATGAGGQSLSVESLGNTDNLISTSIYIAYL